MIDDRLMRKLGYFVALSLLTHLWLLYGVPVQMPHFDAAPRTLEARLEPAPPLPPVVPRVHPSTPRPAVRQRAPAEHIASAPPPPLPPVMTAPSSSLSLPIEAAPPE